MRIYYLWYDERDGRYYMQGRGLHCGEGFEANIGSIGNTAWVKTRIEHSDSSSHSHGWFLVTHPEQSLDDLAVRRSE